MQFDTTLLYCTMTMLRVITTCNVISIVHHVIPATIGRLKPQDDSSLSHPHDPKPVGLGLLWLLHITQLLAAQAGKHVSHHLTLLTLLALPACLPAGSNCLKRKTPGPVTRARCVPAARLGTGLAPSSLVTQDTPPRSRNQTHLRTAVVSVPQS